MDGRTNSSEEAVRKRVREKEYQVLTELSAALNTLSSLQEVLDNIVTLTEPVAQSSTLTPKDKMASVAVKQEKLLHELHEWRSISDNGSTR
jgi:hypothetical protein